MRTYRGALTQTVAYLTKEPRSHQQLASHLFLFPSSPGDQPYRPVRARRGEDVARRRLPLVTGGVWEPAYGRDVGIQAGDLDTGTRQDGNLQMPHP